MIRLDRLKLILCGSICLCVGVALGQFISLDDIKQARFQGYHEAAEYVNYENNAFIGHCIHEDGTFSSPGVYYHEDGRPYKCNERLVFDERPTIK